MGWFGPDPASAKILKELEGVKRDLALVRGELEATKQQRDLNGELLDTQRKLTDLQITYDREQEKWSREKRETDHHVGLVRKRSEFETEAATRTAKLDVREENLVKDQERFDEHVKFIEARFQEQVASLNEIMEKILERMPTTEQLITVGGNGSRTAAKSR